MYLTVFYLPDLSRFTNLKTLLCHGNKLTFFLPLNNELRYLYCNENQLNSLPYLNEKLEYLY